MNEYRGRCEGAPFDQWFLCGEWDKDEIDHLESYFRAHMQEAEGYFWSIYKFRDHIEAKRIEWNFPGISGRGIEHLIRELDQHYQERKS